MQIEMSIEMSRKKREKGTRAETRKRVQYLFRSEIEGGIQERNYAYGMAGNKREISGRGLKNTHVTKMGLYI